MAENTTSLPQVREEEEPWQELMGPELVMKKIDSKPNAVSVQPQDAVVVDFVGYAAETRTEQDVEDHDDDVDDDSARRVFHKAQDWLVIVGEKDVVPALELAIRFMNVGETALVWSHAKYAYGPSQRTSGGREGTLLQAHSHVQYRVTVKSIIDSNQRDGPEFLIRYSTAKKDIGNDVFVNEWDLHQGKAKALQLYSKGASNLQMLVERANENEDVELAQQATSIMIDCLNNVVAVHLRAKDYHAAKQAAVKVLSVDPSNTKALLRAAKAALLDPASSYEEVKAALDAAAETGGSDDNNKELAKLRSQFQQQKQAYKKRSKEFASKMMSENKTAEPVDSMSKSTVAAESIEVESSKTNGNQTPVTPAVTTSQADQEETPPPQDWDLKTLFYFLFKQLLIVAAVFAYTKWGKMGQTLKQGKGDLDSTNEF